ncbi:MAG: hypothetical protein M3N13_10735 [Candidatus Eremiobacteraeota bacterium]|nr:hypothetical protein [Candidatus Eremiobacteraeota bacterium]
MTVILWFALFVSAVTLVLGLINEDKPSRLRLWTIAGGSLGVAALAFAINYVLDNDPSRHPFANYHFTPDPHITVSTAEEKTTSAPEPSDNDTSNTSVAVTTPSPPTPCSDERNAANDALASTKSVGDTMPLSPSERNVSELMGAANTLGSAEYSIGKCIYNTHGVSDANEDAILADDLRVLKGEIIYIHFATEAAGESANLTDLNGRSLQYLAQLAMKEANLIMNNSSASDDERKISAEVIETAHNLI